MHPTRAVIAAAREANALFQDEERFEAGTGVIYDGAMANSAMDPAIRIGSAVFMPDEPLAWDVNARYARIVKQVEQTADELGKQRVAGSNYMAYKRVADLLRREPDIERNGYHVRFRLTYTAAEAQGQVSVTHVKVTAVRDGDVRNVMPVWFVNLKGGFAKDILMPYG